MTLYADRTFESERFVLDEDEFINCTLVGCTLIYRATQLPRIQNCEIRRCRWKLEGAALTFVHFLRELCRGTSSGREIVDEIYEQVTRPEWDDPGPDFG